MKIKYRIMARLKKPKKLKYPKRPKAGASVQVLKNYIERHNAVSKQNKDRMKAYEKEISERKRLREQVAKLSQMRA